MEIISLKFAVLAIVVIFINYIIPPKLRVGYLLLLSCVFLTTFSIYLPVYLAVYAYLNFFGTKNAGFQAQKALFRTGIILNLTQLILLRYASFAIDPFLALFNLNIRASVLSEIILPIGISYYTLQGIGYLINIKMGWEKPENNFLRFFLFLIYFPKFLSGPIERSSHFLPQLTFDKRFSPDIVTDGLRIALQGFFKKVVIANHLGSYVSQLFLHPDDFTGCQIIAIILLQPLYLYFDFSGYTDIAIGFSRALGIELLPNFNRPFLSENMTTFWRRFHISLSSWFNDYIFKQTSFSLRRLKGKATIIAVFLTWILFGIWHGAGWNFIALGFLQAIAIYYEFKTKKFRNTIFSFIPGKARQHAGRLCTYSFYALSLTFFFAPDLPQVLRVFSDIFSPLETEGQSLLNEPLIFGLTFAMMFLLYEIIQNDCGHLYSKICSIWENNKAIRMIIYYATIILILTQLDGSSSFIYEMF